MLKELVIDFVHCDGYCGAMGLTETTGMRKHRAGLTGLQVPFFLWPIFGREEALLVGSKGVPTKREYWQNGSVW